MTETTPSGSPPTGVPTCYRHPDRETYIACQRCSRPICPDCMRDAAVGFQCPQCVAEGAKSTRSGRTAYGGTRSGNPGLTSMVLMGLNALVWVAINVTGGNNSPLLSAFALTPNGRCETPDGSYYPSVTSEAVCRTGGAAVDWVPGVHDGAYWQLVTSAFTHVEVWHIGFNMLALWFLGPQLEAALGRSRFLALYLGSALTASATVYWFSDMAAGTRGASGAIFGLMGGLLVIAYKVRGDVRGILIWLGLNVVITFTFPGISWQGHLGGLLGGLLIGAVLVYAPRERRTFFQAAGVSAVVLLSAVAIVLRSATL
jgi:membrane associated rhomboid family serine protease